MRHDAGREREPVHHVDHDVVNDLERAGKVPVEEEQRDRQAEKDRTGHDVRHAAAFRVPALVRHAADKRIGDGVPQYGDAGNKARDRRRDPGLHRQEIREKGEKYVIADPFADGADAVAEEDGRGKLFVFSGCIFHGGLLIPAAFAVPAAFSRCRWILSDAGGFI